MLDLVALTTAIAAIAPINGVSGADGVPRTQWSIDFKPQATTPQRAAAQALLLTWNAALPVSMIHNYSELNALFTPEELTAKASSTDPQVTIISRLMISVSDMEGLTASDPRFIEWIDYLESVGIVTQLRASLIRSLIPPQLI